MKPTFAILRSRRYGVALEPGRITVGLPKWLRDSRAGAVAPAFWTREFALEPGVPLVGLSDAFTELRAAYGAATLDVALLPPLIDAKRIELPALRPDELRTVLARDVAKYFVGREGPQVVAVHQRRRRSRAGHSTIAAAGPAAMLDTIRRGADEAGLLIETVVPAHAAWTAGARSMLPALGRASAHLLVLGPTRVDLLRLEGGKLCGLRRFPLGADTVALIVGAVLDSADAVATPIVIFGAKCARHEWGDRLRERWLQVLDPPDVDALQDPAALAAMFAGKASELEFITEQQWNTRQAHQRRLGWRLALTSGLMLATAAGLDLWGNQRELEAVQARRASIRPLVERAMSAKDAVDAIEGRLATLDQLRNSGQEWSMVIARVAKSLPRDAHLVTFRGRADTLVMEGIAGQAAGVFPAVAQAPGFKAVRADAPISQEQSADGPSGERFVLRAELSERGDNLAGGAE